MDFNALSMILKPAAALCIGWAVTLIGKKLDGSNLSMIQYGLDGTDKLTDNEKEQLLAIFQQERPSLDVIENIDQNTIAESIEDTPTFNDDTQEQEVEVEAITEAIEKEINESPPDPEESEVMEEMAKAVHRVSGQNPSMKTQKVIPSNVHVPHTPKLGNFSVIQHYPTKSQARITHYIDDEDADSDSDSDDIEMTIRQPDWTQAGSDNEESKPTTSAALSLPLADDILSAGLNRVILMGSHTPPVPEQPKRQLRSRQQPSALENLAATAIATAAIDTESVVPMLTSTGSTASQQFTYGTQITQYGRADYEWQQDSAEAGFVKVLAETKWGERLVTTPYLRRIGLSFNTLYQLIICTQCAEGLPLGYVHTHLSNLDARRSNKNSNGEWTASKVVYESIHPLPISRLPPSTKLQEEILNAVHAAGFNIRDEGINYNFGAAPIPAWVQIPLPKIPGPGEILPRPQILGLRVFDNVWHCKQCNLILTTKGSMATHTSKKHKGSQLVKSTTRIYAQTLSEVPGWTAMLEVSNRPTHLVSEKQVEADNDDLDRAATLALLRQKKATILEGIEVVPDKEVRTVPPVFIRTGIDQFLSPFNRKALHATFTPDRTDPEYLELRSALLPSFTGIVHTMRTAPTHHSIYTRITNCTPGQPRQRRAFSPLTTEVAIASYGLLQVKFVWALITAYRMNLGGPKNRKKNLGQFFKFDAKQTAALDRLSNALEDGDPLDGDLDNLLNAIYFPSHNTTADSIFNSPVIAFLALLCLKEDGSYTNIHLIPPPISKIQFLMRSFALRTFNHWREELGPDGDQDAWLTRCREYCERYLQDQNLAPFASVRYLIHLTSIAARSTPRPDFVWWMGNTVKVGDHTVDVDRLTKFLSSKIEEIEKFVEKSVLLGTLTLSEIEEKFKVSSLKDPSGNEDVLGNGVLFDARNNTLDNPESAEVFYEMFRKKSLGMTRDSDNNLGFDQKTSMVWISDIHKALSVIQPLCHITQGPGPGRMSEECIHSPTNSMNCARNVAFDEQEGTGGFRSGYNKTSFATDDQKIIFRLLPYSVFRLLYILIRLIRPIELTVLLEFIAVTQEDRQSLVDAYKERIWASWGKPWSAIDLSRNLQVFMNEGTGSKIGARSYRHLAIAMQRHFPTTSYGRYNTERDAENRTLARAADLMAGHSVPVAEMNYARQPDIATSAITKAHFVRVSKDWHILLGLSTKFNDRSRM